MNHETCNCRHTILQLVSSPSDFFLKISSCQRKIELRMAKLRSSVSLAGVTLHTGNRSIYGSYLGCARLVPFGISLFALFLLFSIFFRLFYLCFDFLVIVGSASLSLSLILFPHFILHMSALEYVIFTFSSSSFRAIDISNQLNGDMSQLSEWTNEKKNKD